MQSTNFPIGAAALLLAGCINLPTAPQLQPPAGQELLRVVAATGVQIYECRAGRNADAAPGWALVAPDAQLFDPLGRLVGHHGAGPHWTARDGSRVEAVLKARVDAPNKADIPWLLLEAKSNRTDGMFGGVTSIQRVHTTGGQPPADGCSPATLGAVARKPYRADYHFFFDPKAPQTR